MRKLSEKLSGVSLKSSSKQTPHPFVENDAFEGIGDEDLWVDMVLLAGVYNLKSQHFLMLIKVSSIAMYVIKKNPPAGSFNKGLKVYHCVAVTN